VEYANQYKDTIVIKSPKLRRLKKQRILLKQVVGDVPESKGWLRSE